MILKCINYNTWFSSTKFADRMRLILHQIQKYSPDIVALQELLINSLQFFQKSLPEYVSTNNGFHHTEYGINLMSKIKPEHSEIIPFPNTEMGRNMHLIKIIINDIPIHIATTHLESTAQARKIRLEQFEIMTDHLDQFDNLIVMGDMNLDRIGEEKITLPTDWWDVWEKLDYSDKWRYTYDHQANMYVDPPHQFRPDRVYYKSKFNEIEPISFKLIGTKMQNKIQASDHFGLYTQFIVD